MNYYNKVKHYVLKLSRNHKINYTTHCKDTIITAIWDVILVFILNTDKMMGKWDILNI